MLSEDEIDKAPWEIHTELQSYWLRGGFAWVESRNLKSYKQDFGKELWTGCAFIALWTALMESYFGVSPIHRGPASTEVFRETLALIEKGHGNA